MSKETLTNLRDYLVGTLSKEDMAWLTAELTTHAKEEEKLKPYTMEELNAMIDESERDFAEGRVYTTEEVFREIEEELEKEELLLEAV